MHFPNKEGFDFGANYQEDFQEVAINESTVFTLNAGIQDNNVTKAFVDFPAIIVSTSYNFKKSLESYMKTIDSSTQIILSTDSKYLRFLNP